MKNEDTIAKSITDFASKNKVHIHPGQEAHTWAVLVIKKGGCPCVPGRNECPCESVLEDIKKLGRCRCGLFCNDTYLLEHNQLVQLRKKRK